jgi:hypothetical protein
VTATIEIVITVEDVEGLDALPVGLRFQDIDGDVFLKMEEDRYVSFDRDGFVLYDMKADEVEESLPGTVLNPEVLGEFRDEVTSLGSLKVGDPVVVLTNQFPSVGVQGDTGVVRRFDAWYVHCEVNGVVFPFREDEVALLSVVEENTENTEDSVVAVLDGDDLDALPDGSVVTDGVSIRMKVRGDWLHPSEPGTYNWHTRLVAEMVGLSVAYVPSL